MGFPKMAVAAMIAPLLIAAQAPASGDQAAKQPKPPGWDPNEVVCKKFPPPVGSRIGPRRICKTNAEWDYIDRDQERVIEEVQKKPYTSG